MTPLRCGWLALLWLAIAAASPARAQATSDAAFRCGGEVETQVWELWDSSARSLLVKAFVQDGLQAQGDSYALYDLQGSTHNLVAMAVRCGRTERLLDLASIVATTYDSLSEVPRAGGLGWVCRGGRVCKAGHSLHDTEVALTSSQFLGMAMRVASALTADANNSEPEREFVRHSASVAVAHLNRWARDEKMLRIPERLAATPAQARDGQSKWFFTDVDLWVLAIYAELAGIHEAVPSVRPEIDKALSPAARDSLQGLLQLLRARLTLTSIEASRLGGGKVSVADLDRGFWRHYVDNRYAGYKGKEPPVSCSKPESRVNVKPDAVPLVDSGGWDFSHARRLVHVIDALDRQRGAMIRLYKLPADRIPSGLGDAFAAALVERVWNGDRARPLFSNYWDGTNGWYRASYGGGSQPCYEGYAPSGLSDAFALGGFGSWARLRPEIGAIGRRLHALAASKDEADAAFIKTYYPGLGTAGSSSARTLARLQFWPSLVQAAK